VLPDLLRTRDNIRGPQRYRFTRHPEHHTRLLILAKGNRTPVMELFHTFSAIGAHAGKKNSRNPHVGEYGGRFKEEIDARSVAIDWGTIGPDDTQPPPLSPDPDVSFIIGNVDGSRFKQGALRANSESEVRVVRDPLRESSGEIR
jgi:hypothetical protein